MTHQGWIASLSNGETIFETEPMPGQLSAWQALLRRLKDEGLSITQIRLQLDGLTLIGIPGARAYMQASEMRKSVKSPNVVYYRGIGSVIGDQVVLMWINPEGDIWQEIRPLDIVRLHCSI